MAVFIVGGTGFLGTNLARQLVARGEKVVIGDFSPNAKIAEDLQGKVDFVVCDVASATSYFEAVKKYNVKSIFHLAVAIRTLAVGGNGFVF